MNRQEEPKRERKSLMRIKSLCAAAALIKKATDGECITLVDKVSENWSLIKYRSDQVKEKLSEQTLEFHRSEVFLCYTHATSEAYFSD